MRKYKALLVLIILATSNLWGQMPTDGNYSNWNWEIQTTDNWKIKRGNTWEEINPPFSPQTERTGDIVGVYATADYTKAKGWTLLWAQFDGMYPYFALYNPHKGLVRAFFYTDKVAFHYLLATLSYHDTGNPGLLTFGNEYQIAADKYLNTSVLSSDMISVVIPTVGAQNWCSVDFPIFFDNNIKHHRYNSKKWVLKFYGCEDYKIYLKGQSQSGQPASTAQHSIVGKTSDITSTTFSASHAKLHSNIEKVSNAIQKMQTSVKDINEKSPKFLQTYKKTISSLKPVSDVFSYLTSLSSTASAVIGFFKFISGSFDEKKSTTPTSTIQFLELEGSMKIKYFLGGNTLKIPGVEGDYFPPVSWEPFDCVMGFINLEKTPTIRKTTAYEKYAFDGDEKGFLYFDEYNREVVTIKNLFNYPDLIARGEHPAVSGYLGRFVKYKFEDNNTVAINNIQGLTLMDLRFALVFKLTGQGVEKFDIEKQYIECKFWDVSGYEHVVPVVNPIYKYLDEGIFKIYKYDTKNNDVIIGTPELPINKLKDIVIEVPEKSEVAMRMIAIFKSDIYNSPIVYQGNFLMNIKEEAAEREKIFWLMEQNNFHWDSYYNGANKISLNSTNSNAHQAGFIELKPNFKGVNGFTAKAVDVYPTRGNTVINHYNFPCNQNYIQSFIADNLCTDSSNTENQYVKIFPNPTTGYFTISTIQKSKIKEVQMYDLLGNIVFSESRICRYEKDLFLNNIATGLYIVKVILTDNTIHNTTIILRK